MNKIELTAWKELLKNELGNPILLTTNQRYEYRGFLNQVMELFVQIISYCEEDGKVVRRKIILPISSITELEIESPIVIGMQKAKLRYITETEQGELLKGFA